MSYKQDSDENSRKQGKPREWRKAREEKRQQGI